MSIRLSDVLGDSTSDNLLQIVKPQVFRDIIHLQSILLTCYIILINLIFNIK